MYCLFLDIAFGEGVFALFSNGVVLDQKKCSLIDARQPVFHFDAFLKAKGISLDDVEFIACGVGPGSYTGIRSAAATARAISFCTGKKIVAIPSLLLFAPEEAGSYVLAANAGIGGVYSQEVFLSENTYSFEDPAIVSLEYLKKRLDKNKDLFLVTNNSGWLEQQGILFKVITSHVQMIAKVSYDLYQAQKVYDAHSLPLLYLRKTQAELNLETAAQRCLEI